VAAKKDHLFLHIRDLPYFRGLLRAIESRFYDDLDMPGPILDVGCGDGNFGALTFDGMIDVGLDPWHGPIHEAKRYGKYRLLVEADGANSPFPDNYFASGFSNSVLEHIPHAAQVLKEVGRVLKPGAPFYFCVPNPRYLSYLSLSRVLGTGYTEWFRKMSRTEHTLDPEGWGAWLEAAGLTMERWWHYFSPEALRVLEWGHYFGAPTLLPHALFNRWIIAPTRWNLYFTERGLRKYMQHLEHPQGAYTFYIARKPA
jgi:SAM-dependent methyltransferase